MGQYFKIINEDKKEQVSPWKIGGTAKFWEWLWNPHGRVFAWLLRRSDEGGGGDIEDREEYETLGRWAGDRVSLIGDYDSSKLWDTADHTYTDISDLLRSEFNDAIRKDGSHIEEL